MAEGLSTGRRHPMGDENSHPCARHAGHSVYLCAGYVESYPQSRKDRGATRQNPQRDTKEEVGIYTPDQMRMLLLTTLDTDVTLIPALVFGGFQGLRPDEFHGKNVKERRAPLKWESVHCADKRLDVMGKVRSKARRHLSLHPVTELWLRPFKGANGNIWKLGGSYTYKMRNLLHAAKCRKCA